MRTTRIIGAVLAAGLVIAVTLILLPREREERPVPPGFKSLRLPDEEEREFDREKKEEGHAYEAFEWWYGTRAYPNDLIPKSAFFDAYRYSKEHLAPVEKQPAAGPNWNSIGPNNIGGRMLSLAIDPTNPDVIWAGAASGGLWRSATGGEGAAAWTLIDTGFPTLAVSAIVLDPLDPSIIYIGTGEIGRYMRGQVGTPGARSTYGLGVLKSVDGGTSWQSTGLTWTFDQTRAVNALKIDPNNSQTLWAATSEGLYKTTDGGANWIPSHSTLMAMDVVIDPFNSQRVFVSHGQLNTTPDPGIYRTIDGGTNWTKLAGGLPTSNFGRTPLAIHSMPGGQRVLYAGVSDASSRQIVGLYKSTDDGDSWTNINSTNWAGSQAWYDNVVGVSPANPNHVLCGGLDWYRSTDGGSTLNQVSNWWAGYGGVIPPEGPEGPPDYVHADQHAIVFHPTDAQIVYIGSDGGIFKSTDGGQTWAGRNGGLVTTQIYAGFANGSATAALAVGGLQDNGTIKYMGTPSWSKIFGGDGGWCAIDPANESVIYEEYVYLNMYKSEDGGDNWIEIHPYSSTEANFIAPFVICESSPNVLYAGTRGVKKSTNGGTSWTYPGGGSSWNGTPMAVIGVSFTSPDTLCAATGSSATSAIFEVRRSVNGGATWTNVTAGLPNRYPTDITYDRQDGRNVWLTFSGYGTSHVFSSTDAGLTWTDRTSNLPDIPVQSVAIDPANSDWVYVGTDLGIYRTVDGGATWMEMNNGLPLAMILDLVIRPADRLMRAATFGNGVYEIALAAPAAAQESAQGIDGIGQGSARPNPFRTGTTIRFDLGRAVDVELAIFDSSGRRVRMLVEGRRGPGAIEASWEGRDDQGRGVAHGVYFARLTANGITRMAKLTLIR
jgi:photosystem II stability/assembly factor-like uncharacterized protein